MLHAHLRIWPLLGKCTDSHMHTGLWVCAGQYGTCKRVCSESGMPSVVPDATASSSWSYVIFSVGTTWLATMLGFCISPSGDSSALKLSAVPRSPGRRLKGPSASAPGNMNMAPEQRTQVVLSLPHSYVAF